MEDKATSKQIEYIKILSTYPDTKEKDSEDIQKFLSQYKREKIDEFSKKEASALIETLLKRPVKYVFLCGREEQINKSDYNRYNLFGDLEACLHECETDVNSCQSWKDEMNKK